MSKAEIHLTNKCLYYMLYYVLYNMTYDDLLSNDGM